ncbi:SGNH/GDSL hydrolase family protein [Candidatus Woesearchaeota archaeon]|nr:SGNH/GDSL hydrolase family protein [Candidatus Woesearchaeota archaeon]
MALHIAAVGDSHTGKWTALLEGLLNGAGIAAQVCNHGIGGALVGKFSRDYAPEFPYPGSHIPSELLAVVGGGYKDHGKVGAIILQGGANDLGMMGDLLEFEAEYARSPQGVSQQSIDELPHKFNELLLEKIEGALALDPMPQKISEHLLQELSKSLEEMLSVVKGKGIYPVYLNIPPLAEGVGDRAFRLAGNAARQSVDNKLKLYCKQNSILHVDVAAAVSDDEGWLAPAYNSGDGLHLGYAGQQRVAQTIFDALAPKLPKLHDVKT